MNIKKFLPGLPFVALVAACVVACATATVTEPSACDSQPVSFPTPAIPAVNVNCSSLPSVTIPSESTTTQIDLSNTLSKLQSVASNLNVNITNLSIDNTNGEFDWVSGVTVMVSAPNLPMKQLATYTMPDGGATSELTPQVTMSPSDVFNYLSSGPVTLTITLDGQSVTACQAQQALNAVADGGFNTNVNLCLSASGTVTKTLP